MVRLVYNDYFFYKLVCLTQDLDLCYVGSTCNWRGRKNKHKSSCNNPNNKGFNTKKYQIIRSNGGWENFKMIEIGFRENLTLRQAESIEEDYRIELRANMNTNKCNSGFETRQEYNANYQQENREKINAKHECEICGGKFTFANKTQHFKSNKHKRAVNDAASSSSAED
jgi:hypothetical protein